MKRLLIVVLCLFALPAMATHIVGGEFEIIHLRWQFLYRVNSILYFDQLNGAPGARDPNFTTAIFRKRDNQFMENVFFQGYTETNVELDIHNRNAPTEKLSRANWYIAELSPCQMSGIMIPRDIILCGGVLLPELYHYQHLQ